MSQTAAVMRVLEEAGAYLEGHFLLSSGRHAERYLQMALPFQDPAVGAFLGRALAERVREAGLAAEWVVGPALGAIIPGYELARALTWRFAFAERDADGRMALRRGFQLAAGQRVLLCENVVTTGGSAREVIALLRGLGAQVVGVAAYGDRTGSDAAFDVPFVPLVRLDFATWDPAECPLCRRGEPIQAPGSRHLLAGG